MLPHAPSSPPHAPRSKLQAPCSPLHAPSSPLPAPRSPLQAPCSPLHAPRSPLPRKALICGVSGQDGSYLARLLLQKGYEVYGTSRDSQICPFNNLIRLGIRDKVKTLSMAVNDFRSVFHVLNRIRPHEIYNLAGQTSVSLSFEQPVEAMDSINIGTLNLLEAIRISGEPIKLYNASSSESFGDTGDHAADENTPFRPRSPYAVAKASAHWLVANYREAYGLFACNGILFNHESPLRPERFVTKKIIAAAVRMSNGSDERLRLGNIDIQRDWGWAPEYVEVMYEMMQQETPEDFVIATGETRSLSDFIKTTFGLLDLDWEKKIVIDPDLKRPSDIHVSRGNPAKAQEILGWSARYKMEDVVEMMLEAERNDQRAYRPNEG
ncbi:MAG: GDP-mannose 4,6-dehydratase [Deltaproteobacteria bacterium]|nr:GDP-mannose 4,6-dehydratase [Deltaproteobacteria bacterium]MBW2152337.1 GDP-mannose 4,6-dehydratase [Deltaproteobacteria bacterium]